MKHLRHRGVTYEIAELSLAHEDGVALELTEMSVEGETIAEVVVTSSAVRTVYQDSLPTSVYLWWVSTVSTAAAKVGDAEQADQGTDDWSA